MPNAQAPTTLHLPRTSHRMFFRLLAALTMALIVGCATSNAIFVAPELRPERVLADTLTTDANHVARARVRVLLIGDAGAGKTDGTDPVHNLLRYHATPRDSVPTVVVFLGDNVYPEGIPAAGHPGRELAEARLKAQLDAVRDLPVRTYFIPGNHDWAHTQPGGLAAVRRQEALVEAALGDRGAFIPSNGFPGPVEVKLAEGIRMLAIDTEWWLTPHERATGEDEEAGYQVREGNDFLLQLNDLVQRYDDERVLVVGHHPIVTNGSHAGSVPPLRHFFPLLGIWDYGYVPLPILGSLSVLYTKTFGLSRQDNGHPRYVSMSDGLEGIFRQHEGLIYAAGHDHSLQLHALDYGGTTVHQIVSGSGSHASFTPGGGSALFTAERRGFFVLHYFDDGSAKLDAIAVGQRAAGDTLIKRAHLLPTADEVAPEVAAEPDAQRPMVTLPGIARVTANADYNRTNAFYRLLAGDGYRDTWATTVTVPVLDLRTAFGGLTPTQRSGGAQTLGLRLKNPQGQEFQLRSVDKAPLSALPLSFRFGIARDAAEDLTSAVMPFGALVASGLAGAVGVLHPVPQLVWVPDDPRLGRFRNQFAHRLMWLEVRPDGDVSAFPGLRGATRVVGAGKLYREIDHDLDHRVDARAFLRARLLDLFMGDWDRHQDQWRWAAYEPGALDSTLTGEDATQGKVYRPVARDRDWAFNDRDGLLFDLARPFFPKLQGLQGRYGNIKGLTTNGLQQDQRLLAPLDRKDWQEVAAEVQAALTDSVIRNALFALPVEVQERNVDRMYERLRARRDRLPEAAMRWYRLHAHNVNVVGSQEAEVFRVERRSGDTVRVSVYNRKSDGTAGRRVYRRAFAPAETDEIRLWGSGGDDLFEVDDDGGRAEILVRLVGGAGEDVIADSTDGRGLRIYDGAGDRTLVVRRSGPHARFRKGDEIPVGAYGFEPQPYDQTTPRIAFNYATGEGLGVGGGARWTHHGFGKDPYAARHTFDFAVRVPEAGVSGGYTGHFPRAVGILDGGVIARGQTASSFRPFYGYGNNTTATLPGEQYRARLADARITPYLERNVLDRVRIGGGPVVGFSKAERDTTRFAAETSLSGAHPDDFRGQFFGGASLWLRAEAVDLAFRPSRGIRFRAEVDAQAGERGDRFLRAEGDLTLYTTPPPLSWITFAARAGGGLIVGAFPFYEALTLGGSRNVRGLPAHRYAGRSVAFFNVEPRLRLLRFKAGILPYGEFGALGFYDAGRVWYRGRSDGGWHRGLGGGVWGSFASQTSFSATYGMAEGRGAGRVALGFFF
jgi:hypothetical protein